MSERTALMAALAAFATLLAASCDAQQPADEVAEGARERLEQRQANFLAALAAKDADAVAELFTEDGVVHVANMPAIEGRAAIRQFYGNLFTFLASTRVSPEALHVSAGGDMAYGFGTTANEFRARDGAVAYAGKYLLVWRREGGEWRIAAYSISSDAAPENPQ